MPGAIRMKIIRESRIIETPRVAQARGLFDLQAEKSSRVEWNVELPLDEKQWQVGLIVGPSGCGKSTLAHEIFGAETIRDFSWPDDQCVLDGFPENFSIKDLTNLLSRVGFSSPPAWLRPFRALSNGEQFRAKMARALAEALTNQSPLIVCDEFTSVVDRTVARIGAHAVAKAAREQGTRFVAVTCHYDVLDWLQPDWVFDPSTGQFEWRERKRRPAVEIIFQRADSSLWEVFRRHHYLDSALHRSAKCFAAYAGFVGEEKRLAAFAAALPFPHPKIKNVWREHRCVCLPDFQGLGIGHALSEFVASLFRFVRKNYRSTTSHPAMIAHRRRSPLWKCVRDPAMTTKNKGRAYKGYRYSSENRLSAGFEFIGAASSDAIARGFMPEFFRI